MQESLSFGTTIPFVEHLGFALRLFRDGQARIDYTPRPEHHNSFAVTHGGALMTLLDVTMSAAARSVASPDVGAITIELKTSFMQPARGPLSCHGRLMHRTGSMAFIEATVFDAEGRACAHATATFKYVRRQTPAPGAAAPAGALATD